jgi:hypothetical protein
MFDHLVNTKNKRFNLINMIIYGYGIICSLSSLILAHQMIRIKTIASAFEMIETVSFHYIGRFLLNVLESSVVFNVGFSNNITLIIKLLIENITIISWFFIFIYCCYLVSHKKLESKIIMLLFPLFGATYLICLGVLGLQLLNAWYHSNPLVIVSYINSMGYIMLVVFSVWFLLFISRLYQCLKKGYLKEFQYKIIEVVDRF